jgi:hypothetical protein
MKSKFIHLSLIALICSVGLLKAQTTDTQPRDLFYDETAVKEREAIPYDFVNGK